MWSRCIFFEASASFSFLAPTEWGFDVCSSALLNSVVKSTLTNSVPSNSTFISVSPKTVGNDRLVRSSMSSVACIFSLPIPLLTQTVVLFVVLVVVLKPDGPASAAPVADRQQSIGSSAAQCRSA